jgi:hypothetical protein
MTVLSLPQRYSLEEEEERFGFEAAAVIFNYLEY